MKNKLIRCCLCAKSLQKEEVVTEVYASHWPESAFIEPSCEECSWEVFDRMYNDN